MGACYSAIVAALLLLVLSALDGDPYGVVIAIAMITAAVLTLVVGNRRGWFDFFWWKKYR